MSATEPELYLRLLGERTLRGEDENDDNWGAGDFGAAASALVAVGVLPLALAVAAVNEYQFAAVLRSPGHDRTSIPSQPHTARTIEAPDAPVVAVCRYVAPVGEDDWAWDVHYAVFEKNETVLTVSTATVPPWERGDQQLVRGRARPARTPTLPLADDTGHVEQAAFRGDGGRSDWSGEYRTDGPLSSTTSWLEFDGRRLDLVRPASLPTVRVEDDSSGTPADRYLLHGLATASSHLGDNGARTDAAVAALIATGVLEPDAPVRAELATVRAARAGAFRHGFGRAGPATTAAPTVLPEHWASTLRARTGAGPAGVVPVGAATPVIEGAAAVFRALTSTAELFTVTTLQVGGGGVPMHGDHVAQSPPFAWWAQDDLGQWYLGHWNAWSGGQDEVTGDVEYFPALDPRARALRLLPTMPNRRAVVEITLPEWRAAT